jgi:hypothetical protein
LLCPGHPHAPDNIRRISQIEAPQKKNFEEFSPPLVSLVPWDGLALRRSIGQLSRALRLPPEFHARCEHKNGGGWGCGMSEKVLTLADFTVPIRLNCFHCEKPLPKSASAQLNCGYVIVHCPKCDCMSPFKLEAA